MTEEAVTENIKTDVVGMIGYFSNKEGENHPWTFTGNGENIHIKFSKSIYFDRKLKLEKYKNDYEHNLAILKELIEEHINKCKEKA